MLHSHTLLQQKLHKEQDIMDKPSISPHCCQGGREKYLLDVYVKITNISAAHSQMLLTEHIS